MPTQTKQRQKQGQDETRHPPQKSIMQNTDVKQTNKKINFHHNQKWISSNVYSTSLFSQQSYILFLSWFAQVSKMPEN